MGLVKCVRRAEKRGREMPVQKKKKKKKLSTQSIPALNLFPISGNLWEPGLCSLILFSSAPPTPPSSVSHFQFHLLVPLCDFHLISLLKFKIYSRLDFFLFYYLLLLDSCCCRDAPICVLDLEMHIKSV